MPGPNTTAHGNVALEMVITISLSPAPIAANTTVEQFFPLPGLQLGDFVEMNKPSAQPGLGVVNTRCSGPGMLAVQFINNTAAPITPTPNELYLATVTRADNLLNGNPLLTQIT
jgi:hypothetical protein